MKLLYIHEYRERFGVEPICAVLTEHGMKIAPNTYYSWLRCPVSEAALGEAYLVNALVDIYRKNWSAYGVRKMWHAAHAAGLLLGREQVARLMRVAGLQGVRRGVHTTTTTTREPTHQRHPDLVQRGWKTPNRPDAVWVSDFTYVWTGCGFVYVSFVTDVYSRRILGWRASTSKTVDLVTAALDQALATRRRTDAEFTTEGLIHHSDAGSQYTALAFTEQLRNEGIAGSIGTVGDALDNALMESTIGLYKTEVIMRYSPKNWSGVREVERVTAQWVEWYNNTRLHSSVDYMSPVSWEAKHAAATARRDTAA